MFIPGISKKIKFIQKMERLYRKNNITKFVLISFCLVFLNEITAQRIFLCDSLIIDNNSFHGECKYFYNPVKRTIDSILFLNPKTNEGDLKTVYIKAERDLEGLVSGLVTGYTIDCPVFDAQYKNGKLNGLYVKYDGEKFIDSIMYKEGVMDGIRVSYMLNEKTTMPYINGKIEGYVKRFNGNGDLIYFCFFEKDKKNGVEYFLYDNGELAEFTIYNQNKVADGHHYSFDVSGYIALERIVKNGKLTTEIYYASDGQIIKKVNHK